MNLNIEYIKNNYKEFEEITKLMNISSDQLNDLTARKLVPGPSYIIKSDVEITSSLDDRIQISVAEKYFHPAVLV